MSTTTLPTPQNHPYGSSRFVRACLRQPVDRTPVWFLRQAGRYMPEYMAVRRHHSLLDICRTPDIAAEVTITAAERLGVDAAIIFADLLLPFTPMGLDFEFINGEGPVVHQPVRSREHIESLRTDRADELNYVAKAIEKVAAHFALKGTGLNPSEASLGQDSEALKGRDSGAKGHDSGAKGHEPGALKGRDFSPAVADGLGTGASAPEGMDQLGIIGFIGAPFTLASYMIEGGSSRNYIETKKLMYTDPSAWQLLMDKLLTVLVAYAAQQVEAGADVIQIFDSWAGALSVADYRQFVLPATTELVQRVRSLGVPVIYFGVDTASLLTTMRETTADVLGLDWRVPLDEGWRLAGPGCAIQGNLDPITLFAPEDILEQRVREILTLANNRPGHIFNLGHGIVPGTPVDNVIKVAQWVKQHSTH